MFETLISATETNLTLNVILTGMLSALLSGIIISLTHIFTNKDRRMSNIALTLIMLPPIISVIIMLIGSDVAKAFSLAGAFSIIRFRSAPGEPKDIAYILLALATGLASAVGFPLYALLIAGILSVILLISSRLKIGEDKSDSLRRLQITVPEDLEYEEALEDVLDKHTYDYELKQVKLASMGSLYVLTYHVKLKQISAAKQFIDDLRTRNGNLNINLNQIEAVL
jgi:hypothetical protein